MLGETIYYRDLLERLFKAITDDDDPRSEGFDYYKNEELLEEIEDALQRD